MVVLALLGCVGLFTLLRYLAGTHYLEVTWRVSSTGQIELLSAGDPALRLRAGQYLRGLEAANGTMLPAQTLVSRPSPRWIVDDEEREQQVTLEHRWRPRWSSPACACTSTASRRSTSSRFHAATPASARRSGC
jgi:hypothetical protein